MHALVGSVLLGALGLAAGTTRVRWALLAVALVTLAWGWGSLRLSHLDQSVLASRIGTAERAVVEVQEPPRAGSFDQRMKALVLRWGTLRPHEPVYLELPLGRSPPQGAHSRRWSASCGLRPDRRTASTRRSGSAGKGSTPS